VRDDRRRGHCGAVAVSEVETNSRQCNARGDGVVDSDADETMFFCTKRHDRDTETRNTGC
jgi:hypothetical protein